MKSIGISDIDKHKQWAWDIKDQVDFEKEFIQRNPLCGGVIPVRAEWLRIRTDKGRGIDKFNVADLEVEVPHKKEEPKKNWNCLCGKEFKENNVGRRMHVKHCKAINNKEL